MTKNANESDQLLQKNVRAKIGFILTEQSTEGKNIKKRGRRNVTILGIFTHLSFWIAIIRKHNLDNTNR